MPSQILHILTGEKAALAVSGLDPELVASIEFAVGCQATDIFYHNQRTKPSALHFGPLSHRKKMGALFGALLGKASEVSRGPDDARRIVAYLAGFATHAALDRAAHPFIISAAGYRTTVAGDGDTYASCHPFLERILDVLALGERSVADYGPAARLAIDGRSAELLATLYARSLGLVYTNSADDPLLPERARNAFTDAAHVLSVTDPANASEYAAMVARYAPSDYARAGSAIMYPRDGRVLELIRRGDFGNEAHGPWLDPRDGSERRESARELVDRAAEDAAAVLRSALPAFDRILRGLMPSVDETERPAMALGNESLNLPGPGGADMKPSFMSPRPVAGALDAHFAALFGSGGAPPEERLEP